MPDRGHGFRTVSTGFSSAGGRDPRSVRLPHRLLDMIVTNSGVLSLCLFGAFSQVGDPFLLDHRTPSSTAIDHDFPPLGARLGHAVGWEAQNCWTSRACRRRRDGLVGARRTRTLVTRNNSGYIVAVPAPTSVGTLARSVFPRVTLRRRQPAGPLNRYAPRNVSDVGHRGSGLRGSRRVPTTASASAPTARGSTATTLSTDR